MKKAASFGAILASGLLAAQIAPAQGTIYLSNFGETPVGSRGVGSDSWLAQYFTTGTNSTGYVLNSVQLLMNAAVGAPSGFAVAIYSSPGNRAPGLNLGSLTGSDPAAGGLFTFTSSGLELSRSTFYFVVVTAATPIAQAAYQWSAADSFGQSFVAPGDPWTIPDAYYSSANGSSWTFNGRQNIFQFAIDANPNPAPEPGASILLVVGSLWLLRLGRRPKAIS